MVRPEGMEGVYRGALYRVDARERFVLRVGRYSDALSELYDATGLRSAAFLTAANPQGVKFPDTVNFHAESALAADVTSLELPVIPGIGLDADESSDWPGERSLLVLGIRREQAVALGHRYRQLAIIWCPTSAIPELLMLDQQEADRPTPTKL